MPKDGKLPMQVCSEMCFLTSLNSDLLVSTSAMPPKKSCTTALASTSGVGLKLA